MDAPDAGATELGRSLAFIRRVNVLLGYRRQVVRELARFAKHWPRGRTMTVLDVATGSADVPMAILRWARRRGHDVQAIGLDLHPTTLAIARQHANDVRLIRGDALNLPLADGSVDYACTSLFLHHLDEADAETVLREMNRVARRGIIAADLLRNRHAYAWICLLTASAGAMVRHDARVSIAQAYTIAEAEAIRERAGLGYARVRPCWGYRFLLSGQKITSRD
jgi:SAM-dependent methyltransferase